MSTVEYKCDTCKREIELLENKEGLTVLGKCVITNGCRGKLYKTSRNPYNVREFIAEPTEPGIRNYSPRRAFFSFTQTISKNRWLIRHDLGVYPTVVVYDNSNPSIAPVIVDRNEYEIRIINENVIELRFAAGFTGIVHCIARSTRPLSELPAATPLDGLRAVTNSGIMTLATLARINTASLGALYTVGDILLNVSIQEPNREEVFCSELITNASEPLSAWSDWNAILTRKRRSYNIKSFNLAQFTIIQDLYDSIEDIPDGTRFKIISASYAPEVSTSFEDIRSRNIIGLLSEEPHNTIDKVRNKIYDVGDISRSSVSNSFVFIQGELFIREDQLEVIYPEIERGEIVLPPSQITPLL